MSHIPFGHATRSLEYFGFKPLESLKTYEPPTEKVLRGEHIISPLALETLSPIRPEERSILAVSKALARAKYAHGKHPLLLYRELPASNGDFDSSHIPPKSRALELHLVGVLGGTSEALLISILNTLLGKHAPETTTLINAFGSPEASLRYERDVQTYLKRHAATLPPPLRTRAIEDPIGTFIKLIDKAHPSTHLAPQAMEYLNEDERKQFWGILEYLEKSRASFELSHHTVGSRSFWNTLFEIRSTTDTPELHVRGGRHDTLASNITGTPTFITSAFLYCSPSKVTLPKLNQAPIYLAHLGSEAKRKSLSLLQQFLDQSIAVSHNIAVDQLGEQMRFVKSVNPALMLIMGHKEAQEDTIMVRDNKTNTQDTIPLDTLFTLLRRKRLV